MFTEKSLVESEIKKRINAAQNKSPVKKKMNCLEAELRKTNKCIDRLLDAYQANLISMTELKIRIEKLRKSQLSLNSDIKTYQVQMSDKEQFIQMEISINSFFLKPFDNFAISILFS